MKVYWLYFCMERILIITLLLSVDYNRITSEGRFDNNTMVDNIARMLDLLAYWGSVIF